MLDPNIFSKYKTKQDFDREREEFEFRKRQRALQEQLGGLQVQQAQRQLNTPEQLGMEQLLAKSIQLGGVQNLTPQEQAQLQAFDIAQRTKQSVDPRGNIVSNRSVFDMLPGQINKLPPSQVMGAPTTGVQNDPMLANQQADAAQAQMLGAPDMPNTTPPEAPVIGSAPEAPIVVDPTDFGVTSPYGQEDVRKKAAEANIEMQIEQAKADRKTGKAQSTISKTLDELEQLNNKLRVKNAIVSGDKNMLQNLWAAMGASKFGQAVAQTQNIDVQTLRNQYNLARNSLIPFYVDYFQLPATMVDTEEMANRIIEAFGDPSLDYTTNQTAINRMRGQFGIETKGQSGSDRLRYNRQTGRLE